MVLGRQLWYKLVATYNTLMLVKDDWTPKKPSITTSDTEDAFSLVQDAPFLTRSISASPHI